MEMEKSAFSVSLQSSTSTLKQILLNLSQSNVYESKLEDESSSQPLRHALPFRQTLFLSAEIVVLLLVTMLVCQIVLVRWRTQNYRSYQQVTLLAMWLIPMFFSLCLHWWYFCITWTVFSSTTAIVACHVFKKPLSGSTPKYVYTWFYLLYKGSYALGTLGYLVLLCSIFHIDSLLLMDSETLPDLTVELIFYSLYYGVMSRDLAEVCTDVMAAHNGFYSSTGLPSRQLDPNMCAVCGKLMDLIQTVPKAAEKTVRVTCGHVFHEFCIRGWCIVGKKQTCPYCKEKVDLKRMFPGPWEQTSLMYGRLLDLIRYLVAWLPIIVLMFHFVLFSLGLEEFYTSWIMKMSSSYHLKREV